MDPATIVALTIGGITTVSGYGAMKLNAKTKATIDEQVKLAIGDAQEKIASAQKAKAEALQALNKQIKKVEELTDEINGLKKVKQQLVDDKAGLLKNLESATELEKTYRALSPEAFKQAITDFKDKPEIKKLEHPEFFEPLLSRFSVTRGTAQSLYTKFANAVTAMIPKKDFDELLLETLKGADSSLAKVKAKAAAEAADAKKKAAEEAALAKKNAAEKAALAKAAKDKAAAEAKTKKDTAAAEAKRIKDEAAKAAAEAKQLKDARTLQQIVDDALAAAKDGPLTSNTLYQKVKTPFLSGIDSVARGVQKAVDVTKQAAKKTGQVIRAPLTALEKRQADYKARKQQALEDERQALEEQALEDELPNQQGGADTFDTDVNYRLFHPKDGDKPNKVLADLFKRTLSDETLATNIRPIVDAFIYWRKTILNFSSLYKIELVVSAENLFNLTKSNQVNAVFKDEVEKAIEPVKQFKKIIDEPPKEGKLTLRTPTGGTRKKKLRTRRRDKQNVRRTRRSQNRPNRTDTYSSRRSEVDASGDELGL